MDLKIAVVTGASRGIGKAIALKYAREGYHVAISCIQNTSQLHAVKKEIEERHVQCLAYTGDMSKDSDAEEFFSQINQTLGTPDVLINNAGISHIGLLQDMTSGEWNHILQTNLTSVFQCSQLAIRAMLSQKSGKIINISSVWGCTGASMEVAYSTTKGGINAFTRALAKELAPSGIQVNAVACGIIDTDMNQFLSESDLNSLKEEIPAGRIGQPEEVAQFIYDLTRGNDYLTGQVIALDGGWI